MSIERHVIGAMLLDPEPVHIALEVLTQEDFLTQSYGVIFSLAREISVRGGVVDQLTVMDEGGGKISERELLDIGGEVVSWQNIRAHCEIVRDAAIRRKLTNGISSLSVCSADPEITTQQLVGKAEELILSISERKSGDGLMEFEKGLGKTFEILAKIERGELVGVPTGIKKLNEVTGGLQPTDLIVIAARPGMGKTALGLTIAWRTAKYHGKRVAFFSLEMSRHQLNMRTICAWKNINIFRMQNGNLSQDEKRDVSEAFTELRKIPLYIDDASRKTPTQILSQCRRLKHGQGLDLILVDYAQIGDMEKKFENKAEKITEFSRMLKAVAKDLDVPVIALAQLSRGIESRAEHSPMLSDLKWSGGLEENADIVMFIDRPEVYKKDAEPNLAEIIFGKYRNGPSGSAIKLRFNKESASFSDYIPPGFLESLHPALPYRED